MSLNRPGTILTIGERLAAVLRPERKRWVRLVDAVLVLFVAIGIGAIALSAPVTIEPAMLRYVFAGVTVSLPLIAWMLYRETTINRIERIAILLLSMATGFALLHIGMQQAASAT